MNKHINALIQHPHFIRLSEVLAPAELRLVGGCVRDAVLGIASADMDMATTLRPEKVIAMLTINHIMAKPTGIDFGTVTAIIDGKPYEITTLRRDMECDGRHVKVTYSESWEEDAARRDFTLNAMSLDRAGNITDYYGGQKDALAGIIRFVGKPDERIKEDYLRVLRYFRFYGRYGKVAPDAETLAACAKAAPNMGLLSGERVQKEMLKILGKRDPSAVIKLMEDCGVLAVMVPSLQPNAATIAAKKIAREKEYEPFMDRDANSVSLRRLSYLLYQSVLSLDPISARWKLSRAQQKTLQLFCSQPHSLKTLARKEGKEKTWNVLLVQGSDAELAEANKWLPDFNPPSFPLRGEEVLETFPNLTGKALGDWLKNAETKWEESDYKLTKAELLKLR